MPRPRSAKPITPGPMPLLEFDERADGLTMKKSVRDAACAVLVDGTTWAEAAKVCGVPESSIKRAIDRINAPRCPCCGQRMLK